MDVFLPFRSRSPSSLPSSQPIQNSLQPFHTPRTLDLQPTHLLSPRRKRANGHLLPSKPNALDLIRRSRRGSRRKVDDENPDGVEASSCEEERKRGRKESERGLENENERAREQRERTAWNSSSDDSGESETGVEEGGLACWFDGDGGEVSYSLHERPDGLKRKADERRGQFGRRRGRRRVKKEETRRT